MLNKNTANVVWVVADDQSDLFCAYNFASGYRDNLVLGSGHVLEEYLSGNWTVNHYDYFMIKNIHRAFSTMSRSTTRVKPTNINLKVFESGSQGKISKGAVPGKFEAYVIIIYFYIKN